jgi:hypothetical protein
MKVNGKDRVSPALPLAKECPTSYRIRKWGTLQGRSRLLGVERQRRAVLPSRYRTNMLSRPPFRLATKPTEPFWLLQHICLILRNLKIPAGVRRLSSKQNLANGSAWPCSDDVQKLLVWRWWSVGSFFAAFERTTMLTTK